MGWFSRKSTPAPTRTAPTHEEAAATIKRNIAAARSNRTLSAFQGVVAGAQEQARIDKVGANRALTKATEGTLHRWGRQMKEAALGSEGKTLERNLQKNLSRAITRVETTKASHTQASDALKELGKAEYESHFQKRNQTHDKNLTAPYARVLRAAQETKAAATLAEKTASVATKVATVSTLAGQAHVGAGAAGAAVVANAAGAAFSGASAGAFAKTASSARAEAEKSTRENQEIFHQEFGEHASDQAKSRAVHVVKSGMSAVTGHLADDLTDQQKNAAAIADFALGQVDKRIAKSSDDHFQKAADHGRADLRELDNAAATIFARRYRAKKSNENLKSFQDTVQNAQQQSRKEKAAALIQKNFSAAKSNRALEGFQATVAAAQQQAREEKAAAFIQKNFSATKSNRALGALQKAGVAGVDEANRRAHEQISEVSAQFDKESGGKTLGARIGEFFGRKSTHTKLQDNLHNAASAKSIPERKAALGEVQKHSDTWNQRHSNSENSRRAKAISRLQQDISRHL